MTTTDHYADWVNPVELADVTAEYGGCDGPWCHRCGYRTDRSPLANGCECARPVMCDDVARPAVRVSDAAWQAAAAGDPDLRAALLAAARHTG